MYHENEDNYAEFYSSTKLTIAEMRQFPKMEKYTNEQLEEIADKVFDLALLIKTLI